MNWDYYLCTAGWETGLCSGASNIRCCKPCDRTCVNTENSYNDKACTDKGGKCQHDTNKCSSGGYQSGLCGGPSARRCCGASGGGGGSGSCNLVTYSSTRIKGYNGLTVKVDQGFKSEMDKMDGFARQCSGMCPGPSGPDAVRRSYSRLESCLKFMVQRCESRRSLK